MAVIRGKDGSVLYRTSSGVASNVTQITSWSVSLESDTLEFTSFDSGGWKENMGSLKSWSGSLEGFEESTGSVLDAGSTIMLQLSDGTNFYYGEAVVSSKSVDASTAELVTVSYDFTGTGSLIESTDAVLVTDILNSDEIDATAMVGGTSYTITYVGNTDFTAVGAAYNNIGTTFTASGAGTGSGKVVVA